MSALKFKNYTGQSKFVGLINYRGFNYDYTIYLMPLKNQGEKDEIISYFGNRRYKGKLCLDTNEEIIRDVIDGGDVEAFFIVKTVGIDNVTSGSLQIWNWCKLRKKYDVWISDVCKVSSNDVILQEKTSPGSTGNPVDAMFALMEQLVVQNLGKTNIKLFVENEQQANIDFLVPRYKKIGFEIDFVCSEKFSNKVVMEKQIILDRRLIDFSFLTSTKRQKIVGGRYRNKKTKKRKIVKRKTYKRKCRK
jgi:hypothetical protein